MSDTPETDLATHSAEEMPWTPWVFAQIAKSLERERDEARMERDEIMSCIEQAIDYHQVHGQQEIAAAISNLLENINQRRKHDTR